ncbi:MAG TPA: LysR family transcriptional regulator [Pseudonocardia sp.]|jgi:DNA-binding transcriptional LysR family regulator
MIDLRRLRVLRAVAYHGTVTAAAHALYMTPSAASQQIRALGRDLGVTLLEPHGRRVRLTAAGRSLLAHADTITEQWQHAEADLAAANASMPAGELRLCGITTAISALLAPVGERLRRQWPSVTVQIREAEPPECFDLLFAEVVDLVVTMATPDGPPATDTRFSQQPLLDDPYDLLTAPDHPLAGRTGTTLADLTAEPWILGMPGTSYRRTILALTNTAGFTPTIGHEVLEWTAVATLAGHGLGIALLPRLARLPAEPPVVRTPLSDAPSRRLLTFIRRGSRDRPALAAALGTLDEVAAGLDQ